MTSVPAGPRVCSVARTLAIVGEKWALLAVARGVPRQPAVSTRMIRRTGAPREHARRAAAHARQRGNPRAPPVRRAPGQVRVPADAGRPGPVPGHPHPDELGRSAPVRRGRAAAGAGASRRSRANRAPGVPGLRRAGSPGGHPAEASRHPGARTRPRTSQPDRPPDNQPPISARRPRSRPPGCPGGRAGLLPLADLGHILRIGSAVASASLRVCLRRLASSQCGTCQIGAKKESGCPTNDSAVGGGAGFRAAVCDPRALRL